MATANFIIDWLLIGFQFPRRELFASPWSPHVLLTPDEKKYSGDSARAFVLENMNAKRTHRHPDDQKLTTKIEASELMRLAARGEARPRRAREALNPVTMKLVSAGAFFTIQER